jgi:voltage-gated potassium channel
MLFLAVLMVPLILVPEFVDLDPAVRESLLIGEWLIWVAFALELAIKTYLSTDRKDYLIDHWYDVVIVVVPFLRPLRIARSIRLLRMARGLRLVSIGTRLIQEARAILFSHGLHYALGISSIVFFSLVGLALLFERDEPGANITTYGDAVWWGIATITTVGYGDRFPISTEARAISVVIMLLGISLFSLVTASVAATFVRPGQQREEATLEDVLQRLEEMEARLMAMQRRQVDVLDAVQADDELHHG